MTVGKQLKALRKQRGLTQEDLAVKIGIKRSTIANYEIGRRLPCLAELRKFAAFYGVSLDYFGISEDKNRAFELLVRAKDIFLDPDISEAEKDEIYLTMSQLYLKIKGK